MHAQSHIRRAIVAAMLPAAAVAAQSSLVFPLDHASVEGSEAANVPLLGSPFSRYQLVAAETKGRVFVARGLSLRRDVLGSKGSTGTSVDVELRLGPGDFAAFGRELARNWAAAPTLVLGPKRIVLPDWTAPPATPPAPFDLTLVFDRPYVHAGVQALVWELIVRATATMEYVADAVTFGQAGLSRRVLTGAGCNGLQADGLVSYSDFGASSQLMLFAAGPPVFPTSHVLFFFGSRDPAWTSPGLCAPVRTDLLAVLAERPRSMPVVTLVVPLGRYASAWSGLDVFVQAVASDPRLPMGIALSNGVKLTLPVLPTPLLKRTWTSDPTSTVGAPWDPWLGGVVFRIE